MATVVLSKTITQQTQPRPITKDEVTKAYLRGIWDTVLGHGSFCLIISFLFIPVAFTAFMFLYFGIIQGLIFIATVCTYNYLESKYHPLGETGRRWDAFINLVGKLWEPFARMKQVKVVKLGDDGSYSPHRKYMFCFHPHGILFLGPSTVVFNVDKHFPGLKISHLMSSSSFIAPIFRQFIFWIGGIPVTREAARKAIKEGSSLSLIPGGLAEMILCDPRPRKLNKPELEQAIVCGTPVAVDASTETKHEAHNTTPRKTVVLYLQKRKGFVKLALELGTDLVPAFTFGELENYRQVRWGLSWRLKMSRMLKVPLIFIYGKFGLVPYSEPMAVIFGKPIKIEQDTQPSEATIDFYHKKYLNELATIFEENKVKHGHADTRLIFM